MSARSRTKAPSTEASMKRWSTGPPGTRCTHPCPEPPSPRQPHAGIHASPAQGPDHRARRQGHGPSHTRAARPAIPVLSDCDQPEAQPRRLSDPRGARRGRSRGHQPDPRSAADPRDRRASLGEQLSSMVRRSTSERWSRPCSGSIPFWHQLFPARAGAHPAAVGRAGGGQAGRPGDQPARRGHQQPGGGSPAP